MYLVSEELLHFRRETFHFHFHFIPEGEDWLMNSEACSMLGVWAGKEEGEKGRVLVIGIRGHLCKS